MLLAWLVREHGEVLDADFQREYQLDLADLRTGRLRPTRAASLAMNLPPGSMVWRVLGGPMAWTDEMHMLARVEHAVRVLVWQKTKSAEHRQGFPEPIEPPGSVVEKQSRDAVLDRRARAYLRRQEAASEHPEVGG